MRKAMRRNDARAFEKFVQDHNEALAERQAEESVSPSRAVLEMSGSFGKGFAAGVAEGMRNGGGET